MPSPERDFVVSAQWRRIVNVAAMSLATWQGSHQPLEEARINLRSRMCLAGGRCRPVLVRVAG
jgi:hypothetical protein